MPRQPRVSDGVQASLFGYARRVLRVAPVIKQGHVKELEILPVPRRRDTEVVAASTGPQSQALTAARRPEANAAAPAHPCRPPQCTRRWLSAGGC